MCHGYVDRLMERMADVRTHHHGIGEIAISDSALRRVPNVHTIIADRVAAHVEEP